MLFALNFTGNNSRTPLGAGAWSTAAAILGDAETGFSSCAEESLSREQVIARVGRGGVGEGDGFRLNHLDRHSGQAASRRGAEASVLISASEAGADVAPPA
jgi:hypothetical protein